MPWSPEKLVQLTECLRFCRGEQGSHFSTAPSGKSQKSQRDRQLTAARKILAEIPELSEEQYVTAYSEQNNEWWNREKGSLTVEDMAASTPRKVMRAVELLEKVRSRSEHIKKPPSPAVQASSQPVTPTPLSHDQACQLAKDAITIAKERGRAVSAQAVSLDNNTWGIVVRWNTPYFEKPETFKSQRRLEGALKEMGQIWQREEREKRKQVRNG